jgi:hypothetical protein
MIHTLVPNVPLVPKVPKAFLIILLLLCGILPSHSADIVISPETHSLHDALRQARELRRLDSIPRREVIRIQLKGGVYPLYEPLLIRPEDSGTEDGPTIFEAVAGETPVVSGGVRVSGWKKEGKYWTAAAPECNGRPFLFRQLWVNGRKAVRARNVGGDFGAMDRIRFNDREGRVLWVPAAAVARIRGAEEAEMVIHQMWAVAVLRIKSITVQGDSAGLRFHDPEARVEFEHPWPQPMMKPGFHSAFYLTNALALLDEPGEWYFDSRLRKIYYMPQPDEDMRTAEVIVPYLETLVQVEGTIDRPVRHIHFRNIGFQHANWTRPSEQGHVPLQAGMFMLDAYKLRPAGAPGNQNKGIENQAWIGRPAAAVLVGCANNIRFEGCAFERMGACALDFSYATQEDWVVDCVFRDIAGNGLQIGKFSDVGMETHLPYDPADGREVCSHQYIYNNLITDAANEDWGCVGIAAGYVRDIHIAHNEVSEVSYTGISLGWGWTKTVNCMRNNRVEANYIHHYAKHMYDVAGIYTLSAQSNTFITGNRIDSIYHPPYAHDPNHWFYLYTDEGSSFITVRDNWCPGEKFLQNANGPGNTWGENGGMVSDSIKSKAGRVVR